MQSSPADRLSSSSCSESYNIFFIHCVLSNLHLTSNFIIQHLLLLQVSLSLFCSSSLWPFSVCGSTCGQVWPISSLKKAISWWQESGRGCWGCSSISIYLLIPQFRDRMNISNKHFSGRSNWRSPVLKWIQRFWTFFLCSEGLIFTNSSLNLYGLIPTRSLTLTATLWRMFLIPLMWWRKKWQLANTKTHLGKSVFTSWSTRYTLKSG